MTPHILADKLRAMADSGEAFLRSQDDVDAECPPYDATGDLPPWREEHVDVVAYHGLLNAGLRRVADGEDRDAVAAELRETRTPFKENPATTIGDGAAEVLLLTVARIERENRVLAKRRGQVTG